MNRFFISSLFILFAAAQCVLLNGMKRKRTDDSNNPSKYARPQDSLSTFKQLPVDAKLECLKWMLDVETPELLLASLQCVFSCACIDKEFSTILSEDIIASLIISQLHNFNKTLSTFTNKEQLTVLHYAALENLQQLNPKTIHTLILAAGNSRETFLTMVSNGKHTALHLAACFGNFQICKQLIREAKDKADKFILMQDSYQQTALHASASIFSKNANAGSLLIKKYSNNKYQLIAQQDTNQRTALHLAAQHGNLNLIKKILKIVGPLAWQIIAMQDIIHNTALHLAVLNGHADIVQLLLNAAGNMAQQLSAMQNLNQDTALVLAQNLGHQNIVYLLSQPTYWPCQIL